MTDFKHDSIQKLALDVNNSEDIERVVNRILVAEGRIDILVNNAGVMGIREWRLADCCASLFTWPCHRTLA